MKVRNHTLVGIFLFSIGVAQAQNPAELRAGQSQQVNGQQATWVVDPPIGTVSSTGVYTAPAQILEVQTVTVTQTVAGSSISFPFLLRPTVQLSISPSTVTIADSADQQFTVSLQGAIDTSVTWSIVGVGTISDTGVYTAPPYEGSAQSVTIIATSVVDPTSSSTAVITLGATPDATITLPIEVVGADGSTVAVPFTVRPEANISGPLTLFLRIHNLKYQSEASLRINNSAWTPIDATTATLQGLAKAYGGIGGAYSTLKLTMAMPGLVTVGPNTLCLRFNGTDGRTSGFRVLDFNIHDSAGSSLLPATDFVWDDPANWVTPLNTTADIAAGKTAFQKENSLRTQMTGPVVNIKASCSDCHTQDGRDLKYFNYSNTSIRARSMFHGLTAQQGDQIASYIRSLQTPSPGRPWNPPYQPGVGLDSKPVEQWAAGAGIDAVLDSDAAMLPFVSPNLTMADFSAAGNLSARETPIAFQLPDWNNWLPQVHPLDAFPSLFPKSVPNTDYANLRKNLAPAPTPGTVYAPYRFAISQWSTDRYNFQVTQTPATSDPSWSDPTIASKLYSVGQWQTVKMWELNQEFGLEGQAKAVFGAQSDSRAWYTNSPFFTAPSIMRIPVNAVGVLNGSKATFHTLSFVWYYLQMILDDSQKTQQCGSSPLDWGYTIASVGNVTQYASVPQAMSLLTILLKGLQISQNGKGPEVGCTGGWNWRNSIPSTMVTREYTFIWKELPTATRAALLNAYVGAWFAVAGSFTPAQYYKGLWTTAAEPVSPGFAASNFASGVAFMIPHLHYWGLNDTLTNSLVTWAASMWPNNGYNWNQITTASCHTDSLGYVQCSTDK